MIMLKEDRLRPESPPGGLTHHGGDPGSIPHQEHFFFLKKFLQIFFFFNKSNRMIIVRLKKIIEVHLDSNSWPEHANCTQIRGVVIF